MILRFAFIACLLLISSCKNRDEDGTVAPIGQQIGEAIDEMSDEVKKLTPATKNFGDQASDEVLKVFRWEYRVEHLPRYESDDELARRLDDMGKDRWECFHVEPTGDSLQVFCKRFPRTLLRYLYFIASAF